MFALLTRTPMSYLLSVPIPVFGFRYYDTMKNKDSNQGIALIFFSVVTFLIGGINMINDIYNRSTNLMYRQTGVGRINLLMLFFVFCNYIMLVVVHSHDENDTRHEEHSAMIGAASTIFVLLLICFILEILVWRNVLDGGDDL